MEFLPGNHLGSVDALRLPDDADRLLRVVQVVQQHSDHVVPVFGALVGPGSFFIPGSRTHTRTHTTRTNTHAHTHTVTDTHTLY